MQWIQYSLDALDWLHGRPPARSAGEQVSMWNCLHLLPVLLGWSFGAALQPHMDFSLAQGSPPLRGHATRVPWPWNLDQRLPALTAISWQCGCQFHVQVTSNPYCVLTCTPHYFLFIFPLCLWPLLFLSLDPSLSQDSWIALFIYHCFILALKDIHNLGMGGKWRGWEWMLSSVPGNGLVENFQLCQAKQEGQESCRGQPSPRKYLNSLGKTREIYWIHWSDTSASILFIIQTQLEFYF